MIVREPAPRLKPISLDYIRTDDIWEMVHEYRCFECCKRWSMSEDDDKPEFCPYCGKASR